MDKLIIFDANGVKWIIEDRREENLGGPFTVWGHVAEDEMTDSGYLGNSVSEIIKQLNDDGYMDGDGCYDE